MCSLSEPFGWPDCASGATAPCSIYIFSHTIVWMWCSRVLLVHDLVGRGACDRVLPKTLVSVCVLYSVAPRGGAVRGCSAYSDASLPCASFVLACWYDNSSESLEASGEADVLPARQEAPLNVKEGGAEVDR